MSNINGGKADQEKFTFHIWENKIKFIYFGAFSESRLKLLISNSNKKKKRSEFRKRYVRRDTDFRDEILISDENKCNISQSDGQIKIRRQANTKINPENIVSTVRCWYGDV